ncbi:putative oligomeric Golgi complex, subunit 2 [Helianthus annuus]|nr:putative oligomeric Golgi complex, subunit 2 [Helianthus annuus]KAJ0709279.1 putative oligomeric Golgi complex, subunit 2 [Helianthus annuus]KAJ0713155.1 putative oligomeric Golgi complex, subunit 2 [Helianthus annuus]KAJ0890460.1 putative oligomeric Golgi complex, subunit 2 [Helianthus annuus]KAJ0895215.1 putative oligomeric Golgi complex, subunit 2 [Helianthus annuus]
MAIQQQQPPATSPHLSPPPRTATADLFGDPIDSHPLWFKQSSFLSPNFDSESYISDLRTFVPFETLRSELQSHLSSLKHELVELINRDYADFVNLSTKLVDVDAAVLRMRAPLIEIRDKIVAFRGAVEGSLVSLQGGLRQRAEASAAREILELLIDTSHVVSKVEKLIKELHNVPVDGSNGDLHTAEKGHLSNGVSIQHVEIGANLRETQSMLLERIASEMNRLKFYFAHAKNLPFIENMEKRIQNASSLLDTSLGHCFIDGLVHKDENAVYNCLRAYAAVDNTRNAEEIFRSTIVAPLVQKVIPYTSSGVVGGLTGDDLEEDYKQIKQLIAENCIFLLEISSTENSGLHVFSFLANSILKEVLYAIQQGKPGAFSPGRPTEFLKNYKASLGFLADLEGYCPSRSAVSSFRAEAVYVDFMKQWNIGVYFSLRFQEIAGSLDSALVGSSLTPIQRSGLTLKQSVTLLECIRSCWKEDVLVISISDKFLRLTLQLISRYANWLSAGLSARRIRNAGSNSPYEWALTASHEDLVYIINDLDNLAAEVCGNYIGHVFDAIKTSTTEDVLDLVKNSISQGGKSLKDLVPSVIDSIIDTLVDKSNEELKQLHGIVAAYRMTKKPPPVRHSHYVSGVLRPLKVFLDGERATTYLTEDVKGKLVQGAAFKITGRYHEMAADIVNTARKTETSLQRIRLGAQRRAGASSDVSDVSDHNVSDTEKICMQLFLDIQEYGRNLATLEVEAAKIPAYCSLWQLVAPQNRQAEISF